jgi:FkbM family methyltransferase
MGTINALSFLWKARVLNMRYLRPGTADVYRTGRLRAKQLRSPMTCRYGSTDFKVFNQIFFLAEYEPLQLSKDPELIVDCGAYVGYSTAYFLSKYPKADVIAVEPDRRNYELLKQNLTEYGGRVTALHSAVWSHKTRLRICHDALGEWATQVRECKQGEQADIEAVDIPSILERSKHDKIDILKLDIEGAETVLFSRNFEPWIDRVDAFVVELHGDSQKALFFQALSREDFDFSTSGELTMARRRDGSALGRH